MRMRTLITVFKARDLVLKKTPQGFRIKLEPGIDVDIHAPEKGSDRALLKIRISDPDPDNKQAELNRVYEQIKTQTNGVASMYPFKIARDAPGIFVYDAVLDLAQTPVYHETVVLDDARPARDLQVQGLPETETPGEISEPPAAYAPDSGAEPAADAVRQLETVDARMFRLALDDLDLPRTSNLRLILSRLHRSAIEADELRTAAKAESEKLTSPADLEELERISAMNPAAFLRPLIRLLSEKIT